VLGSLVARRRRCCDSSFTTIARPGLASPRGAYCSPARHRLKTKEAALLPQRAILQRLLAWMYRELQAFGSSFKETESCCARPCPFAIRRTAACRGSGLLRVQFRRDRLAPRRARTSCFTPRHGCECLVDG
jgi:hypothetical protein